MIYALEITLDFNVAYCKFNIGKTSKLALSVVRFIHLPAMFKYSLP
jgi:hypothetical protein